MIYDFVLAGNCNLITINVVMLFLPRGVHSECELLPLNWFWWIGIYYDILHLALAVKAEV